METVGERSRPDSEFSDAAEKGMEDKEERLTDVMKCARGGAREGKSSGEDSTCGYDTSSLMVGRREKSAYICRQTLDI